MQVVDDHHERCPARGELGEHVVQAVPDALRVDRDRLAAGAEQADRGADGVVPVAEHLVALGLGEPAEDGLEQLAQYVVRLGVLLLAAAGEQDGAALPGVGAAADLVQQGGLPEAGPAGEDQQLADLGAAGRELPAQLVHRRLGRTDFGIAVAQGGAECAVTELPRVVHAARVAVPAPGLALGPAPQFAFLGHCHALRLADPWSCRSMALSPTLAPQGALRAAFALAEAGSRVRIRCRGQLP